MSSTAEAHHEEAGVLKLTLALAALVGGVGIILGAVSFVTLPETRKNEILAKERARKELLATAQEFKPLDDGEACRAERLAPPAEGGNEVCEWYVGLDAQGRPTGYVLQTRGKGYGGPIQIVAAVDPEQKVTDYRILRHNETPGLGEKAKEEEFRSRFKGKEMGQLDVVKKPDPERIEAITGATITSRAVTEAIRAALQKLDEVLARSAKPDELKLKPGLEPPEREPAPGLEVTP